MLLLMQPRMWEATGAVSVCVTVTLMGHVELRICQHPQILLVKAVFSPFSVHDILVLGIAPAQMQPLAPGFVERPKACRAHLSILSRFFWIAFLPSSMLTATHSLVSSANLLRVHPIPPSLPLNKTLNNAAPNTDTWGAPVITVSIWLLNQVFKTLQWMDLSFETLALTWKITALLLESVHVSNKWQQILTQSQVKYKFESLQRVTEKSSSISSTFQWIKCVFGST